MASAPRSAGQRTARSWLDGGSGSGCFGRGGNRLLVGWLGRSGLGSRLLGTNRRRLGRQNHRHPAGALRFAGALRRRGRGRGRFGFRGAAAQKLLDAIYFFIGETGQRRPFAGDAGIGADVHQILTVKL